MRRVWVTQAVAWVLVILFAHSLWSQNLVSLRGNVTDPSGAAIPNASVRLINTSTNSERTATTGERGDYAFQGLAPGTYRLFVEALGFEKYQQDQIRLQPDTPATIDVKLKINQVQQTVTVTGQGGQCLAARARVLPDVGADLHAIRLGPSGNYYVLTNPGTAVAIYSRNGRKIGQIPAQPSPAASIVYGADLQLDSAGLIYVADRGANAVKIYSPQGALLSRISVAAPISVEPLSGGEVAVASLLSKRLVQVYDARGEMMRSFGDVDDSPETEDQPVDMKRLMNRGWFYGDASGNVYFNLVYLPDPTIRKFDSYGYAAYDITILSSSSASSSNNSNWDVHFKPEVRVAGVGTIGATSSSSQNGATGSAQDDTAMTERMAGGIPSIGEHGFGMHGMEDVGSPMGGGGMGPGGPGGEMGEHPGGFHRPSVQGLVGVLQLTQRSAAPDSKLQINALAVDPSSQEVWASIGGDLVHYDRDGNLAGYYCLASSGPPVKPTTMLIEPDRILLGTNPFGIFDYIRPDKVTMDTGTHH